MTPEEMRKIKKSLKIYSLQENSKSFKKRKHESAQKWEKKESIKRRVNEE